MAAPNWFCDIIDYELDIKNTSSLDIRHKKTDCADIEDCRTVIMDTSHEKIYIFTFKVRSLAKPAFNSVITQELTVNIVCGAEI